MKAKYEVVPFNSGTGYFLHGGNLGETYVANKEDADLMCAALNQADRWKTRKTLRLIENAMGELETLRGELV